MSKEERQIKIEIDLKKLQKKQRIQILIKNKTGAGKHDSKKDRVKHKNKELEFDNE